MARQGRGYGAFSHLHHLNISTAFVDYTDSVGDLKLEIQDAVAWILRMYIRTHDFLGWIFIMLCHRVHACAP